MRMFSKTMPRADFNDQVLVAPMEVSAEAMNETDRRNGAARDFGGSDIA